MAKGKGKNKGKKSSANGSGKGDLDPASRAIFSVQLKALEEKLQESNEKCEILKVENQKLSEQNLNSEAQQKLNFEGFKKQNENSQSEICVLTEGVGNKGNNINGMTF